MRFTVCFLQLAIIALVNAKSSTPLVSQASSTPMVSETSSTPVISETSSTPSFTPPLSTRGSNHSDHGKNCQAHTNHTNTRQNTGTLTPWVVPKPSSTSTPLLRLPSSALGSMHGSHGANCKAHSSTGKNTLTRTKKNTATSTPLIRLPSSALRSMSGSHGANCKAHSSTGKNTLTRTKENTATSTPLIRLPSSALRSMHGSHGANCKAHTTTGKNTVTQPMKNTVTKTTSTPLVVHNKCYHSANSDSSTAEHGWCVCDGGITHPAPADAQCPQSTIPASWIPKSTPTITPTPTTHHQSKGEALGYPYTYNDYDAAGALVGCASSTTSVMEGLGLSDGPVTATVCAGDRKTLQPGVEYTSTASITPAGAVSCGNWASKVAEPSPIQDATRTSEASVLAVSIYKAFSKACVDTTATRVMTINTTSWDDSLHHMSTVSATPTMTACGSNEKIDVIEASYLMADKVETGTIQVSVIDSYFTKEHIHRWMWQTAYAYAFMATSDNHTKFVDYEDKSAYTGNTKKREMAQHFAPQWVSFYYHGSFNPWPMESFATQMHFHLDEEEQMNCELMTHFIAAFVQFGQTLGTFGTTAPLAGVEAAALEAGFRKACEASNEIEGSANLE